VSLFLTNWLSGIDLIGYDKEVRIQDDLCGSSDYPCRPLGTIVEVISHRERSY